MRRPVSGEYPEFSTKYINLVKGDDILRVLRDQVMDIHSLVAQIPEEKETFSYAPGKWTICELLGHLADTERILSYRALRFARRDSTELSGFDENAFVANAGFSSRKLSGLTHEFALVREANIALFKTWDEEILNLRGKANGNEFTVRALLFMIAGHVTHHVHVIRERYLES